MTKSDEDKEKFREANKASRKAFRIAKDAAYEDLYAKLDSLDSREEIKMVFKACQNQREEIKGYLRYAFHQPFGRPNTHCMKRDHTEMANIF